MIDLLADEFDVPREEVKSWTAEPGGAVSNVTAALAKFGVNVAFITNLGLDNMGTDLITFLKSNKLKFNLNNGK